MTNEARVRLSRSVVLLAFLGLAAEAGAQCVNTGGGTPTDPPLLASKVVLGRGLGGLWGDGNDRYRILKGLFTTGAPLDPVGTHNLHIAIRKNGPLGPVIHATTVPAGGVWTASGSTFSYSDPLLTYGVRRIVLKTTGPNDYLLVRLIGRGLSLANMPLVSPDSLHVTLEFESGGAGECLAHDFLGCTYGVTSQSCF